jgi:hypothetical protein
MLQRKPVDHEEHEMDADELVGALGVKAVPKILGRQELGAAGSSDGPENRWIVAPKHATALLRRLQDPKKAIKPAVLSGHMLTAKDRYALQRGNVAGFLASRRHRLVELEREFVRSLGLGFVDPEE